MQEILRRASAQAGASSDDGIRHEELLAAAREAGLDPGAVEAAATELLAGETARQALERVTAAEVARRRRRFRQGALSWSVFAAFSAVAYLVLGAATGLAAWAFALPALVWSLFVALAGARAVTPPDPEAMERRVDKERRATERERQKQRAKEAAEAWARTLKDEIAGRRSRSDLRKQKALELEDAIEDGVRAVLGALARAVKDAVEPPRDARGAGDFARYVEARRTGHAPPARSMRVEPDRARTRVRVEEQDDASAEASEAEAKLGKRSTRSRG